MTIQRLVVHENPEGRATPLLLLAALRDLDPAVELVYFGARDWRLGAVRPTPTRLEAGMRILDNEERRPVRERSHKNVLLALLLKQGFAQIAKYTEPEGGDINSVVETESGELLTVLRHFERIQSDWVRDQGEADVRAQVAANTPDARKDASRARFSEYMATEGRAHYAREVRGRVQSGYGTGTALLAPPKARLITGDEVMADIAEIVRELGGEDATFLTR